MNRRQFFASTVGAAIAAVLPWKKAQPVEWCQNTTGMSTTDTDEGIRRATFKFWRNADGPRTGL